MIKKVKNTMVKLEWIIALIKELHAQPIFIKPALISTMQKVWDPVINMELYYVNDTEFNKFWIDKS